MLNIKDNLQQYKAFLASPSHVAPYVPLYDFHTEDVKGTCEIMKFTINAVQSLKTLHAEMEMQGEGDPFLYFTPPGKYVKLHVDGEVMMSDVRMEQLSCKDFVERANGKVLIAGLGLGMVLAAILPKPEVEHVTVMELRPEVVALTLPGLLNWNAPLLKQKLCVEICDAFTRGQQYAAAGRKFDTIFFDIWPTIDTDNLLEIRKLHVAYRSLLRRENPRAWMNSWMRGYLHHSRLRRTHKRAFKRQLLKAFPGLSELMDRTGAASLVELEQLLRIESSEFTACTF